MKYKSRTIALFTVIIMIFNMFSPFTAFFNTVNAASNEMEECPVVFNNLGVTQKGSNKVLAVQIAIISKAKIYGLDLKFKVNTEKIEPCSRLNGNASTVKSMYQLQSPFNMSTLAKNEYDKNTQTYRLTATEEKGGIDLEDIGYIPGQFSDQEIDENGKGFDVYYPLITVYFRLKDNSLDANNLQLSQLFTLSPQVGSLPTGMRISYEHDGVPNVGQNIDKILGKGFAEAEKEVERIELTRDPSNKNYEHGQEVNLEGGQITAYYTDKSDEVIDLPDPRVNITSGSPANVDNNTVKLEFGGQETSFEIQVTDPVVKLEFEKSMTKLEYTEGQDFETAGVQLKVTNKSGNTETITLPHEGVEIDEKTASVTSKKFHETSGSDAIVKRGTQDIDFKYQGQTVTQTVVVNDEIEQIVVEKQPTNKYQKYGEDLNLSGASVKVNLKSGGTSSINLPNGSVQIDSYDKTKKGEVQNLKVRIGEDEATNTIDVEVYDYVSQVEFTAPNKDTYKYGDQLEKEGGKFRLVYKSGDKKDIPLTNAEVSITEFNPTSLGTQRIQASYTVKYTASDGSQIGTEEITREFEVDVQDKVQNIEIVAPTDKKFKYGGPLTFGGGEIKLTYAVGETTTKPIDSTMVVDNETSEEVNMSPAKEEFTTEKQQKVTKTLKIQYSEDGIDATKTYEIEIINDVRSIEMHGTDYKQDYKVNEELDKENTEIRIHRAVGDPEVVNLNNSNVTVEGYENSEERQNITVNVKYTENGYSADTSFNVNITDKIERIEIENPPKYAKYNHDLDLSESTIKIVKSSGKTQTLSQEDVQIEGFTKESLGPKEVTIKYEGVSTQFSVTVQDYVEKITLNPDTVTGKYGTELSELIKNVKYQVTYACEGVQPEQQLDLSMIEAGFDETSTEEQILKVKYTDSKAESYTKGQDFKADLKVILSNTVKEITITAPNKKEYQHGDELDTSGTITVKFDDGSSQTRTMDKNMFFESDGETPASTSPDHYDTSNKENKHLKIKYEEGGISETIEYDITIINTVTSIELVGDPKQKYNVNDPKPEDLQIKVTRKVGEPDTKNVEANMISDFDTTTEGPKHATITYEENNVSKTCDYSYTVKDVVKSIKITTQPKQKQKYKEPLDLSGAMLQVEKGSKTEEIPIIQEMIKEETYDNTNTDEEQTVELEYGEDIDGNPLKATFKVKVLDYVKEIKLEPSSITGDLEDNLEDLLTQHDVKYIVVYAKEGPKDGQKLITQMMESSTYLPSITTPQRLKVTYKDINTNSYTYDTNFEAFLTVTLANSVREIRITPPENNVYKHGEKLNLEGATVEIVYQDNSTISGDVSKIKATEGEEDNEVNMKPTWDEYVLSKQKVSKKVKLEYTDDASKVSGTADYNIEIINDVRSIKMNQDDNPITEYNVNDHIDLSQGSILVQRAVGDEEKVELDDEESRVKVTNFDSKTAQDDLQLTVTFTENGIEKTTTYNVNIVDKIKSLEAVSTENPLKVKYGEDIDFSKVKVTATKGSGPVDLSDEQKAQIQVTDFDKHDKDSVQTVKLTYGGATCTLKVQVQDYVKNITLNKESIEGKYNSELDTLISENELKYTVHWASGEDETQELTSDMVSKNYNKTELEAQTLTITYTDNNPNSFSYNKTFDTQLTVKLTDEISEIQITVPKKQQYNWGDELDVSDGKIKVIYTSGREATVQMTPDMVKENDDQTVNMSPASEAFKPDHTLEKQLTIKYTENKKTKTENYTIKIIDTVVSVELRGNPKTEYKKGQEFDRDSGELNVTRASGNQTTEKLTDTEKVKIKGFNSDKKTTNQKVEIEYTENGTTVKTDHYVNITDKVSNVEVKEKPTKSEFEFGDSFEPSGGRIEVTYESGDKEEKTFDDPEIIVTEEDGSEVDFSDIEFGPDNKKDIELKVEVGGKETTLTVTVVNKIISIEMERMPKQEYHVKEQLDKNTTDGQKGTILVRRQNGNQSSIELDNESVKITGFDSQKEHKSLQLTVSYTENKVTLYTNYTISVIDKITNMEIETTPKQKYKYGESLDVSGGKIKVTRESGTETIPMDETMITEQNGKPFNGKELGTRQLNVTYGGITKTYTVTVSDFIKGIVLTPPKKLKYEYGEVGQLDLTGGGLQILMASGKKETVELTDKKVHVSGFKPKQEGTQTITVTYDDFEEFEGTFAVRVEDNVQSIIIITEPTKKEYKYGEPLNVDGGQIKATKSSGETEIIDMSTDMVKGYDPNKLGEQTLTVTYKGKTVQYKVKVVDYTKDIKIVKPKKLIYKIDEKIDLTGGKVSEVMASGKVQGTVDMSNSQVKISGFDTKSEGAKIIKVTYKGFTKTFGITVVDPLSNMIIKTLPDKLDYLYGESLDVTGGTIEVQKESGKKQIIKMTKSMVSGYNSKKLGTQKLTVTYEGLKQQFIVNVEDYVSKLKIQAPLKVEYEYGEYLDLTGGKVSILMASGKIDETVNITSSMITGFDSKREGKQNIKVTYKGLQGNFQVNVVDKVKGISMNTEPNKIIYNYGENLDLTGATISVFKSSGKTIKDVTKSMVTGYSATTPGTQIITVKYAGFETKFIVKVNEQAEQETVKPNNTPTIPSHTTRPSHTVRPSYTPASPNQTGEENKGQTDNVIGETQNQEKTNNTEDSNGTTNNNTNTLESKEKPTKTLGVKDEKDDNNGLDNKTLLAAIIGSLALIILLLLIIFRRNVIIYVEEDGEFALGGLDKIKRNNPKLDIDKYLDKDTYSNRVKIRLNDVISEKLDGKEIKITHRGKTIKHKIKYNDEPYEFILDEIKSVKQKEGT